MIHFIGSKVIKFCGRQLHVAPSFHLYLTTTDPPNTISPSLSTTMTVINCASSLPLSQEMLLDTAFHVFHEQGWTELRKTVEGVAKCRSEVTKLERELFESVGREEEGGYWWSTEKIAKIMAAKKEVWSSLPLIACSMQKWRGKARYGAHGWYEVKMGEIEHACRS